MMKCALVTGGSNGIGRAVSLGIAKLGYHVVINFRSNTEEAEKTLSMVRDAGGSGELLRFDVANRLEVESVLGGWIDANADNTIDVLVNNAGITRDNLLLWMKTEEWEDVINTDLNGFFYVTRVVLKGMLVRRFGRIVNVASLSGLKGVAGQTNYSAAKAGVIGATRSLAQEVAKKNITVNAVAPGFIHTEMTKNFNEKDFKQIIPMQRFGTPEEVAEVVSFLSSEKSSYITGEVISVTGGLY
jgi:3-oxoacyl-[acyl-carrier protein] reductase